MTGKATAKLTPRKLQKIENLYYVIEASHDSEGAVQWEVISKGYAHSTSAFAALGRLYQKELLGK